MNHKIFFKIIASVLLCSVFFYTTPILAYTKDETVYSKLDTTGTSYQTIVTNHIKNNKQVKVLNDLSDLINIKNVNGDESFTQDGNRLVWNSNGNDIYYQGETQKKLPIECRIKYELDEKEISSKDLIGQNGKLKITLKYSNKEERFVTINGRKVKMYVPFVVTTGLVIENNIAKNVTVSSGKVIDDGTKTIVLGIAMPGLQESLDLSDKDIEIPDDIEITMDVTNFEMGNIISYVTPKVLDKKDLTVFDNLDDVYHNVNTLKISSNEIQKGSKKLADGTAKLSKGAKSLKSGASSAYYGANEISSKVNQSIKALNSDKSAALDQKTLKSIESQATSASILTDKQIKQIKSEADDGVESQAKSIKTQAVESAKQIAESTALQTALTVAQSTAKQTAIETAKSLNPTLDNVTLEGIGNSAAAKVKLTDTQKAQIIAKADNGVESQRKTIESRTMASAKQVAEASAIKAAQAGATTAAKMTATTVAEKVSNQVKQEATNRAVNQMKTLSTGLNQLTDGLSSLKTGAKSLETGVSELHDGASTLSKGIQTFNKDGISKICHYINSDIKDLTTRIKKLTDLSKDYTHFTMLDGKNLGEVKFIMIIDSIKNQDENKKNIILNHKEDEE